MSEMQAGICVFHKRPRVFECTMRTNTTSLVCAASIMASKLCDHAVTFRTTPLRFASSSQWVRLFSLVYSIYSGIYHVLYFLFLTDTKSDQVHSTVSNNVPCRPSSVQYLPTFPCTLELGTGTAETETPPDKTWLT